MSLTRKIVAGPHSVVRQRDISAVREVLELIKDRYGILTPKNVVDYVRRNPSCILKRYFDDPKKAAVNWWITQAQKLIQSFYVFVEEQPELPPMRLYVSVKETSPKRKGIQYGYVDSFQALGDDRYREQLLNEAVAEITSWQQKYQTLKSYSAVIRRLDRGISRVLKHRKNTGKGRR